MKERVLHAFIQLKFLKFLSKYSLQRKLFIQNILLYFMFFCLITLLFYQVSYSYRKDILIGHTQILPKIKSELCPKIPLRIDHVSISKNYDKKVIVFKIVPEKSRNKYMSAYVLLNDKSKLMNHIYYDKQRLGIYSFGQELYGYYVTPDDNYADSFHPPNTLYELCQAFAKKLKRCLMDKWSPITGVFKFIIEILSHGLDETIAINEDSDHELLQDMIPHFESAVKDLNNTANFISHITYPEFNIDEYSQPIGFIVLFTESIECEQQPKFDYRSRLTFKNFLSTKNVFENIPSGFSMSFAEFIFFKIGIMLKSAIIISSFVLIIHSMNYIHLLLKYSLLIYLVLSDMDIFLRIAVLCLLLSDDYAEIILTRHRGFVNYRIECYVASFLLLNCYSIYSRTTNYIPICCYLIFVIKRAFDYILSMSVVADHLLAISNTVETISRVTNNDHAEVLFLFLNNSSR